MSEIPGFREPLRPPQEGPARGLGPLFVWVPRQVGGPLIWIKCAYALAYIYGKVWKGFLPLNYKLLCVMGAVFGITAFGTPAFAQDENEPLSRLMGCHNTMCNFRFIKITSRVDSTTIKKVIVNRGNCRINDLATWSVSNPELPRTLKFGQSLKIVVGNCKPIEVQINTDEDNFFTYSLE